MSKFDELICKKCGGELQLNDEGKYKCSYCGRTYEKKAEDDFAEKLRNILNEEKFERLSAARRNLWDAMHEEYINSETCVAYARELKSLVPDDYFANFAESANSKNDAAISKFLNESSHKEMDKYADVVLEFMLKSLTPGTLTAVSNYIDRAFIDDSSEHNKYIDKYADEALKVDSGVFELSITRKAFIAYSSKDIAKVQELTDYLEEQGISCFISSRNLRHGTGAVDNYDKDLQTAMDNCCVIVFVSSKNSRNLSCDAFRKELPYIRKTDKENAPAEYKNLPYDKIPREYKKPRIQYILDGPKASTADENVKEFFDGYDQCESKEKVASRIFEILTKIPSVKSKTKSGKEDGTASSASDRIDKRKILETKDKNVLEHVGKLVEMGNFNEAMKNLSDLEKEEIDEKGKASVGVYYYKILAKNRSKNFKEIVKTVTQNGNTLKCDSDYLFAMESPDDPYKEKIIEIENRIEEINVQTEREAKEKAEKERQRREQEKLDEEERKRRYAEAEKELERLRVRKFCMMFLIIIVAVILLAIAGIILGFTVPNATGAIIIFTAAFLFVALLFVNPALCPSKNGDQLWDQTAAGQAYRLIPFYRKVVGIIFIAIAFAGLFIGGLYFTAFVTTTDENGFKFLEAQSYCYVSGYEGDSADVVIPSEHNGKKVTKIRREVFMDNETIVCVTIPDSVNDIKTSAFEGCTSLETVTMYGSVAKLCEDAFYNCYSLVSIDLTGVKKIGKDALGGCGSLSEVTFSEGLKRISKHAFINCIALEEITIPSSVKYIGKGAFHRCGLTSAYFVDPTGWKYGGETVDPETLSDPISAATLLLDSTYEDKTWKH